MTSILHIATGPWGQATVYKENERTEAEEEQKEGSKLKLEEPVKVEGEDKDENKEEKEVTPEQGEEPPEPKKPHSTCISMPTASRTAGPCEHVSTSLDPVTELFTSAQVSSSSLPHLYSTLFGTILEDTNTQLQILVQSSNEIKIIKTRSDWDALLRKKFGVKEPEIIDELDGIDYKRLNCNEYKINKLDADRIFIIDVIQRTYLDLSLNKTFKALEDSVNAIVARDNYRIALAAEEARKRILRRDLARQLRQLRNHIKTVLYDIEVKIDELISQCEDSVLVSETRTRYIDNWQRARTEQHVDTIHDKEVVYTDSMEYYKTRTDHEHRVHLEIEMLMGIAINETLQKVEDMMTKYEEDMEAIDLKIQIKKNDYQNMLDKRIELQETIAAHEKAMEEWVFFKDEREKARLYREKMNNSAIMVQAWWRGLLVRRQLGQFKPPKKKKQPKKK